VLSSLLAQERRAKSRVKFPVVVGDLFALTNGAAGDNVSVVPMGVGLVRMVHVVVMIDGQQDFAVNPVSVIPDVITCRFGQFGKLCRRVDPVEALNETPDLCAFANDFRRKDPQTVDGAFIKISFDKKHGSYRGKLSAYRQFVRPPHLKRYKPARRRNLRRRLAFGF